MGGEVVLGYITLIFGKAEVGSLGTVGLNIQ